VREEAAKKSVVSSLYQDKLRTAVEIQLNASLNLTVDFVIILVTMQQEQITRNILDSMLLPPQPTAAGSADGEAARL
jgi:hypothetical protein